MVKVKSRLPAWFVEVDCGPGVPSEFGYTLHSPKDLGPPIGWIHVGEQVTVDVRSDGASVNQLRPHEPPQEGDFEFEVARVGFGELVRYAVKELWDLSWEPNPECPRRETQRSIGEWAVATFPGGNPTSPRHVERFLEEAGELAKAAGLSLKEAINALSKTYKGMKLDDTAPDLDKVPEEAADVNVTLNVMAYRRDIDLPGETDRKMVICRSGDWMPRGDGTGYHSPKDV